MVKKEKTSSSAQSSGVAETQPTPTKVAATTAVSSSAVKTQQNTGKQITVSKKDQQNEQTQKKVESTRAVVSPSPLVKQTPQKDGRVQIFGLYFHNSKTLGTFLFFAIGMIIVPIATYLCSFGYLSKVPEINSNQAQMYAGFLSVGVVILFMIGYCVVAITDESNFQYEQREYDGMTEQQQKDRDQSKLREAFEENALENGIKEVIQKKVEKKEVVKSNDVKKEIVVKKEIIPVKKEEIKKETVNVTAPVIAAKQDASQKKKKDASTSSAVQPSKPKETVTKKEVQQPEKPKPQESSKIVVKKSTEDEDSQWNEVKPVGKKGKKAGSKVTETASAKSQERTVESAEIISHSSNGEEEDDGFIIVRQKKVAVVK